VNSKPNPTNADLIYKELFPPPKKKSLDITSSRITF
jgi:hypothetical protein